jgi:PAS domain S-box-containing protein
MDAETEFPWCLRELVAGKVIAAASIEALPAEAARDKEAWRHHGIKSNLTFPLSTGGGQLIGALSFNTIQEERSWPEATVTRLQLVAQIFANALARKRADQELHDSEERLSLAADAAAVGLWRLNLATGCFWLTKQTRELFEFAGDGAVSFERFLSLVHPDDQERIRQAVKTVVQLKNEIQVEYRVVRPDGSIHWVFSRGRVRCDETGEPNYLMGVSSNITERKRTEEALRGFSARLINTQEKERARLARELHDDITQRLARLAIDVGKCTPGSPGEPPADMARSVRDGLIQLSEDVHALSYRLHPSILEDLGLAAALKAEAARFARQDAIPVEVKVQDIPETVSSEAALCVFRVAQEAFRNAARHAGARSMKLSLRSLDDGLQLAVQDDGCGFEPALQRERPSLGLASMRERVHLVGGELEIESAPGHGTTVLAWVPLKGNET